MKFRAPQLVTRKLIFIDYSWLPEIMLWTGLLDKNGVEIYEGDIIRDTLADKEVTTATQLTKEEAALVEVIGNRIEGVRPKGVAAIGNG